MRDPNDNVETRQNLARWLIQHTTRLELDLRLIRFLDDCVEAQLALLPRELEKRTTYRLSLDYVLGRSEAEHAIEDELRFALCELQKQHLKAMGLA
jgi:hypothetical protein